MAFQKGHIVSEEIRKKISESSKGKKMSDISKKRLSESLTGKIVSMQARKNMSLGRKGKGVGNQNGFKKGQTPWNKGKKSNEKTNIKLSISHKRYFDKIGRADIKRYHHNKDRIYLKWRSEVFKRDNFTCQICNQVGGYLQAHHIKSWAKYPKLRYNTENGVTLCLICHKGIHKNENNL